VDAAWSSNPESRPPVVVPRLRLFTGQKPDFGRVWLRIEIAHQNSGLAARLVLHKFEHFSCILPACRRAHRKVGVKHVDRASGSRESKAQAQALVLIISLMPVPR
jgi:hypothetical protein